MALRHKYQLKVLKYHHSNYSNYFCQQNKNLVLTLLNHLLYENLIMSNNINLLYHYY